MNSAPSLRDLQLWIKWIVTDPRGANEALGEPPPQVEKYKNRYTEPTKSQLAWIENNTASSAERLSIYAEGYFSRILECLGKDFSRTKKVVGEETFTKLVAEYLKAYPSRFTSIDEVGYKFANFISEFDDSSLVEWVSDLASFEWKWLEAFYAKEPDAKDSNWREKINSGRNLNFKVHPSVHILKSNWPLAKIIGLLNADIDVNPRELESKPSGVLIYRSALGVSWEELELTFLEVIQNLKNNMSLEVSLTQAENIAPENISKTFSRWVEKGILCGTQTPGEAS